MAMEIKIPIENNEITTKGIGVLEAVFDEALRQNYSSVSLLSGIALVILGIISCYQVMKLPPNEIKSIHKIILGLCFFVGVPLIGAHPLLNFAKASPVPDSKHRLKPMQGEVVSSDDAFARLRLNEKVMWVARLIAWSSNDQLAADNPLSIKNLKTLGGENQRFTFVADYTELVGKTGKEAAEMLGANMGGNNHISAVIFPLNSRKLFPANAKGFLQVLDQIENHSGIVFDKSQKFNAKERIKDDGTALAQFEETSHADNWAFDNYKDVFDTYCTVAQKFRCDLKRGRLWPVASYVGTISDDWNPLGFSQKSSVTQVKDGISSKDAAQTKDANAAKNKVAVPSRDPCGHNDVCKIEDWSEVETNYETTFGARIFLMENAAISDLNGRILIDMDDPKQEKFPAVIFNAEK